MNNMRITPNNGLLKTSWRDADREAEYRLNHTALRDEVAYVLREDGERFQSLINKSGAGYFFIDRKGRFQQVNEAWLQIHGYSSPDDIIGKHFSVTQIDMDHEETQKVVDRLLMGEAVQSGEYSRRNKDGSVGFHTLTMSTVKRFGVTIGLEGFLIDTTKHRLAEEALRQRDLELKEAQRLAHIGSWTWDARSDATTWSEELYRIFNLDPRLFSPNFHDHPSFYTQDSMELLKNAVQKAMETGEPYELELELANPSFTTRWIIARSEAMRDAKGAIVGLRGTAQNITERRQTEELSNKAEGFVRDILESVTEEFIVIDAEYRILSANKAYCVNSRKTRNDIIGGHCYEVTHRQQRPCSELGEPCPVKQTFETGIPSSGRHVHQDSEGNNLYVDIRSYPVKDASGKIVSVIETITDVTEKKKLEEQLLHAQKMEAIGQIAGGVAHDFNNILTAIIGYGSLMQMKMNDDDPMRTNVDHILACADRAGIVTHGLLAFSRKQAMSVKPVNMNEIILRVESFLKRLIGEDIEFKSTTTGEDLVCEADSGQIEQVLMNLATNARDAMPKGGCLTMGTDQVLIDSEFVRAHGFGKPGTYALISMADTGSGMDEKTRRKIFEPFFTTKDSGKGTGLGLSIVYGIVKQHNGYINVYSEPGKGTTFRIYIPQIQGKAAEGAPALVSSPPLRGTELVLIAEDDAAVRDLTRVVLEEYGYHVITAEDGDDAIKKFIENRERIQLTILDLIMPKKSGKEVYDEIRKISPGMKVLFQSGYTADRIHREGIIEEGLEIIQKPVVPRDLMCKVREALDK